MSGVVVDVTVGDIGTGVLLTGPVFDLDTAMPAGTVSAGGTDLYVDTYGDVY